MIFPEKRSFRFAPMKEADLGSSEKDIAKLCPQAKLLKGLAIHGTRVNDAKKDIANWLEKVSASF